MAYQSEAALEQQFIDQLNKQGYTSVSIPDYDALVENFKAQFETFNSAKLDRPLTDKEWERVMNIMLGKSVFQSAKILRDKFVLEREDGTKVYLSFFDADHTKNIFQVTNQTTVVGKYVNRYDVTIFVNGLPLIQVELKRRGIDIREAVNQVMRYGDVLVKYGAVVNISEDTPPYIKPTIDLQKFVATSYLRDGDIVFADTAEDYSVGKATEIAGANGLAVLSGLHTIPCRPLMKFHPMYLAYYFNSSLFRRQIYPLVQGTKVSSISKGELVKTSVYAPTEREQRRIASMLYLLDLRITFEEKTVNALTNARTALLQQLFI